MEEEGIPLSFALLLYILCDNQNRRKDSVKKPHKNPVDILKESLYCNPSPWISTNENQEIFTIFYQGLFCSQDQIANYTTGNFLTTTNELVHSKKGIEIIQNPFIGKEIEEVMLCPSKSVPEKNTCLEGKSSWERFQIKLQLIYLKYRSKLYGLETKPLEPRHHGPSLKSVYFQRALINIGQEGDVQNHRQKFELCEFLHPNAGFILFGASRGAVTTFNSIASYHYQNVKLVILESCFYSLEDLLYHRFSFCRKSLRLRKALLQLLEIIFPRFSRDHNMTPFRLIDYFPENIPVVFITSRKDGIVPVETTVNIAKELSLRNRNPVYLLVLCRSSHNMYPIHNSTDQRIYLRFIHALYRKYDLPFIPQHATLGQEILLQCQLQNSFYEHGS